jgi:hypothetical protein
MWKGDVPEQERIAGQEINIEILSAYKNNSTILL